MLRKNPLTVWLSFLQEVYLDLDVLPLTFQCRRRAYICAFCQSGVVTAVKQVKFWKLISRHTSNKPSNDLWSRIFLAERCKSLKNVIIGLCFANMQMPLRVFAYNLNVVLGLTYFLSSTCHICCFRCIIRAKAMKFQAQISRDIRYGFPVFETRKVYGIKIDFVFQICPLKSPLSRNIRRI